MIHVGANYGMLHAFNAATGYEVFAEIPAPAYANLTLLANPYDNAVHQFYVNGSPQASDVQFSDNSWHTLLVGTEAQGGGSVYAIDVSNPAAITTESVLANDVLWDSHGSRHGPRIRAHPRSPIRPTAGRYLSATATTAAIRSPFCMPSTRETGATTLNIDPCAAVPTACKISALNGLSSVIGG